VIGLLSTLLLLVHLSTSTTGCVERYLVGENDGGPGALHGGQHDGSSGPLDDLPAGYSSDAPSTFTADLPPGYFTDGSPSFTGDGPATMTTDRPPDDMTSGSPPDGVPSQTTPDAPSNYRISELQFFHLSPTTAFPAAINPLLAAALGDARDPAVTPIDLLLHIDYRTDRANVARFCQGDQVGVDRYACRADPPTALGQADSNDPTVIYYAQTGEPWSIDLEVGGQVTRVTFHYVQLGELREQPNGQFYGQFGAIFTVSSLCQVTTLLPSSSGCGNQPVNWLDLMDGPAAACGQDQSTSSCVPDDDLQHWPPDAVDTSGQSPPYTTYSLTGLTTLDVVQSIAR
jgi:hypothetical protein